MMIAAPAATVPIDSLSAKAWGARMFNLQSPGQTQRRKGPDPASLIYLLVSAHAACLTPFMRRSFGTEAFRVHGVAALLLIMVYGAHTQAWSMWIFLKVWIVMLILQRFLSALNSRRRLRQHSRYTGSPFLAYALCRFVKKETIAKGVVEPLICLIAGYTVAQWDEPLGAFIMMGLFSLLIKLNIEQGVVRARVRMMRDAEIEQRQVAEAFRGRTDFY